MIPLIYGNKFDEGIYQGQCQLQNSNFDCRNQIPYTFIIPFNYPFETIPQVFITLDLIGVSLKTDFRIQIQDVTISNFSLLVVCLTGSAHCVRIKWYAIDDQRFQIINSFNTKNLTEMTYQHKNKNVNTGFITLISHNFDEINFKLQVFLYCKCEIIEITSENVTVSLTKVPEDFQQQVQVGFQIILGPKEAFQNFLIIDSTNEYSKLIEEKQNAWFITPFTGMGYPNTDAVRLEKKYQFQGNSLYQYILATCKILSKIQGTFLFLLVLILMDFSLKIQLKSSTPQICNNLKSSKNHNYDLLLQFQFITQRIIQYQIQQGNSMLPQRRISQILELIIILSVLQGSGLKVILRNVQIVPFKSFINKTINAVTLSKNQFSKFNIQNKLKPILNYQSTYQKIYVI
ncbi:unnamed protein product [Paramecium pentaurelia]|uniref:H-type lectin domain-containing protein n=1 Tax=Paramecium pentaurelia TaxID=43138 RepID=A0A8S1YIC5_9CILI|nr:unnamed protein product [Paramecium pentaurelia]